MKFTFIFLLFPFFALSQDTLPRKAGKIVYEFSFPIKSAFQKDVKIPLAKYVMAHNGSVERQENKMDNYIVYEDTSELVAGVKTAVRQNLASSMWGFTVNYKKQGDSVSATISDIILTKTADMFIGYQSGNRPVEEIIDSGKSKGMLRKLNEAIISFIQYYK